MRACESDCSPRCPSDGAMPSRGLDVAGGRHRGAHPPSREAEYLFYQTLVAAHPLDADRACAYMLKAAREAKLETELGGAESSIYEERISQQFVRAMVSDPDVARR